MLQRLSGRAAINLYLGLISNSIRRCSSKELTVSEPAVLKYLHNYCLQFEKGRIHSTQHSQTLVELVYRRQEIIDNVKTLNELRDQDKKGEVDSLLQEENEMYERSLRDTDQSIIDVLFTDDTVYKDSECILEISAGVGGQEAMLFAKDMLKMYEGYAKYRGWTTYPLQLDTESGSLRHASIVVNGPGAYELLQIESGVHRVQRVPETERSGRMHTSTVTISVMLQPTEIEVQLHDRDLRFETKRSSGAGGQHVNTTDSCVRVTHLPTGIAVESQSERDQHKNKKNALTRLRAKIYQKQLEEQEEKIRKTRKSQVGTGLRNEKIRTYNFNQDRVTDHRIGGTQGTIHDLKGIMEGNAALDGIILKLRNIENRRNILDQIESFRDKEVNVKRN